VTIIGVNVVPRCRQSTQELGEFTIHYDVSIPVERRSGTIELGYRLGALFGIISRIEDANKVLRAPIRNISIAALGGRHVEHFRQGAC